MGLIPGLHTRCFFLALMWRKTTRWFEHFSHTRAPQLRQWCRRRVKVNFLRHKPHLSSVESACQTAALRSVGTSRGRPLVLVSEESESAPCVTSGDAGRPRSRTNSIASPIALSQSRFSFADRAYSRKLFCEDFKRKAKHELPSCLKRIRSASFAEGGSTSPTSASFSAIAR